MITEKREIVASVLVVSFVAVFFMVSLYELISTGFDIWSMLILLGVSLLLIPLAFKPRMFFVSFKRAFDPALPTILISPKMLSLMSLVALIILLIGNIGSWVL